jgi:hypothetical protein
MVEFSKQVVIDLTRKACEDAAEAVNRTMQLLPPNEQPGVVISCAANLLTDVYRAMVRGGFPPEMAKHQLCTALYKTFGAADEAESTGHQGVMEIKI